MSRRLDLSCEGYDRLLASVMAPEGSVFRLSVSTNDGERSLESPPAPSTKREYILDLQGATAIESITVEVWAAEDDAASGWFNWLGLRNSALVERYRAQWNRFDPNWEPYIVPESYEPRFEPSYGFLINSEELEELRLEHDAHLQEHGDSPYLRAAREAQAHTPEEMVRDFVNFWNDTRYCRERDHDNALLPRAPHGSSAALAGLLLKDKSLLRLAARYGMALAMCGRWDDGMICYFPGSNFEHRCFVQSLCIHEAALLLDLAGEMFTEVGQEYLLRRIAEEGQGAINYNAWKQEYIFHCNQLAWFTPGRMLGYALMEREWPRVKPYTDMALEDLIESLGYAILPDGGYVEGPSYFQCVGRNGGLSLHYYARARGLETEAVIPDIVKRTGDFAEAILSTDENTDVIPICDAGNKADQEMLAFMAAILPHSQWLRMLHKSVARTDGLPEAVFSWLLGRGLPQDAPPLRAYVELPDMGIVSSLRWLEGEPVKLFIMGNEAGAGHTHEDKGSFVLEFAGETFAMDPGTCDYSSPLANMLKNCQRHNMLLPSGVIERPHPQSPLMVDVKAQARGDADAFHAEMDLTPGWEDYYVRWQRTWDSPTPNVLTISDTYELAKGDGVEFLWNTRLPAKVTDSVTVLRGKRGTVTIEAPADCTVRLDELPLLEGGIQRRIAICKSGTEGELTVRVRLQTR